MHKGLVVLKLIMDKYTTQNNTFYSTLFDQHQQHWTDDRGWQQNTIEWNTVKYWTSNINKQPYLSLGLQCCTISVEIAGNSKSDSIQVKTTFTLPYSTNLNLGRIETAN